MARLRIAFIALVWVALLSAGAYGYAILNFPQQSAARTEAITLNGAGATLAFPLLSSIIGQYTQNNPGIEINYQPVGSETGIDDFTRKIVDFGATYPPMTPQQKTKAPGALHVPESISAVALTYNLPGIPMGLNLTGSVLAEIFLYNITNWSDPAIRSLNPNVNLPNKTILTVHADDAGSTFVFTGFLSQTSSDWQTHVGQSITPDWPGTGVGVPADAQVAELIRSDPDTIGYMELSYALQSRLDYASVQNPALNFVMPTEETTKAAASQLNTQLPSGDGSWAGVNLLNKPGLYAYPLVTFTYLLVYKELSVVTAMNVPKARLLINFLWYVVHDGQALGPALDYVPLPPDIVAINEQSIRSVTFNGQSLLTQ